MTDCSPLPPPPPVLRLCGPVDLLVAVPYLLGFAPDRSLVVVALDGARRVVLAARSDLPGLAPHGGQASGGPAGVDRMSALAAVTELGAHVADVSARAGACSALAVVYPSAAPTADDPFWREFASALCQALGDLALLDTLIVRDRRWRSLVCAGAQCCPAEGRELPAAGTTAAEAAAVMAGLSALPARADVARVLTPAAPARREPLAAMLAATAPAPALAPAEGLRQVDDALTRRRAAPHLPLPAREAAALLVAVSDSQVRDAVSWPSGPEAAEIAVSLWAELVRLAPVGWVAGPATLLAAAAYQGGNGVLAGAAAGAALLEDPAHVLAAQLVRALELGMGPHELRAVFELGSRAARASIEAMG